MGHIVVIGHGVFDAMPIAAAMLAAYWLGWLLIGGGVLYCMAVVTIRVFP